MEWTSLGDKSNSDEKQPVVYKHPLEGVQIILTEGIKDEVDLTSLFRTSEGKRFANQVASQKQFTLVGILFPMMIELFVRISPKIPAIISDDKFGGWFKEKVEESDEMDQKSRELLSQIPEFVKLAFEDIETNSELPSSIDELFGERANERFLGSMVLSLHSYLQAYIDSIIDSLIRTESVRSQFLEYWDSRRIQPHIGLADLAETSGDKYDVISELVKRSIPLNLLTRMKVLCNATKSYQKLESHLREYNLEEITEATRYFCDLRNRIAHGEPAPPIDSYGFEISQIDWKELENWFVEELLKVWPDPPTGVFGIIEMGCEWAQQHGALDYFTLLDHLPRLALMYAAVFDYTIHETLTDSSTPCI